MYLILMLFSAMINGKNPKIVITDSETEILPIKDDVVYNIQKDCKGGVTVTTSDGYDYTVGNNESSGNTNQLCNDNKSLLQNFGKESIIGYAPTPGDFAKHLSAPVYTTEEYKEIYSNTLPNYTPKTHQYQEKNLPPIKENYMELIPIIPNNAHYSESSNGAQWQNLTSGKAKQDSSAINKIKSSNSNIKDKESKSDTKNEKDSKNKKKKSKDNSKLDKDLEIVKSGLDQLYDLSYLLIILFSFK